MAVTPTIRGIAHKNIRCFVSVLVTRSSNLSNLLIINHSSSLFVIFSLPFLSLYSFATFFISLCTNHHLSRCSAIIFHCNKSCKCFCSFSCIRSKLHKSCSLWFKIYASICCFCFNYCIVCIM